MAVDVQKLGYQLKRGAKPVGTAYFGSPIQKWADLYVLEVQCQKPKPKTSEVDCWLFLNCEVLTGFPPEKCPNRKNCKQNALHSHNRSCSLFYEYDHEDSNYRKLIVRKIPDYALGLGWEQADPLFYEYEEGSLTICRTIPEEAQALGFAKSQVLPYEPHSRPGYLWVSKYHGRPYPPEFKEAGWYPATELPFYRYRDPEDRLVKVLSVNFRTDDPEYSEAIAAGWHPAVELPSIAI